MEDQQKIQKGHQCFFLGATEPLAVARIQWQMHDDNMIITHTYVDEELRGQAIAEQLLDAAVAEARQNGYKIVPQCSYVQSKFNDDPETYKDVMV